MSISYEVLKGYPYYIATVSALIKGSSLISYGKTYKYLFLLKPSASIKRVFGSNIISSMHKIEQCQLESVSASSCSNLVGGKAMVVLACFFLFEDHLTI